MILKIIWARRLVWYAHDNNRLNEGQAGSRPGRNAIDVVIQEEMKYLFSILSKTGLATWIMMPNHVTIGLFAIWQ